MQIILRSKKEIHYATEIEKILKASKAVKE